jgi:aspartate aminotransferase
MAELAQRMRTVGLSPTMKGTIEAERLKRAGVDVVDLGAGEPDFPMPAHIAAAAHAAIDQRFTKYTANPGTAELREAIARRYAADYGVEYAADEVIVTAGGKQALYHAAMALFGPGDEVITHQPGWPTIVEQIKLTGAAPVVVETLARDGFAVTADTILSAATPRTRGIVLNSPGNPTGAMLSEPEAARLAAGAAERGIWVVMDLCYEKLIYGDRPHNLPRVFADVHRDRTLICGSASKTYAMTGLRCGWLVGPRAVVQAAGALQSHQTSNANSITQKAAVAALTGSQAPVEDMLAEYTRRRDALVGWLADEPRLRTTIPQGAFYLFPSVAAFLGGGGPATSLAFADRLLAEEHVVTTAGEAFGAPGFIRLSYAASMETLREGAVRLIRFARRLAGETSRA